MESWFISNDFHHSCFVCHTAGTWSVLLLTTSHILRIRHWLMIPGMGCRSSTTQPTLTLRLWTRWPREPSSSLAARFGSLVVYVGRVVSRYEDSYANLLCLKPCVFPCFPLFLFSKQMNDAYLQLWKWSRSWICHRAWCHVMALPFIRDLSKKDWSIYWLDSNAPEPTSSTTSTSPTSSTTSTSPTSSTTSTSPTSSTTSTSPSSGALDSTLEPGWHMKLAPQFFSASWAASDCILIIGFGWLFTYSRSRVAWKGHFFPTAGGYWVILFYSLALGLVHRWYCLPTASKTQKGDCGRTVELWKPLEARNIGIGTLDFWNIGML